MKHDIETALTTADWCAFLSIVWRLFILALAGFVGIWCAVGCLIYFHYILDDLPTGILCAAGCMGAGFLMTKEALK